MNDIQSEFIEPQEVIEDFINQSDKFKERYVALLTSAVKFIEANEYSNKVKINRFSLGYMLLDYFEDIRRLKEFHGIEHINTPKIIAYISYWFLKRKPIQILEEDKELIYINERFILAYISDAISKNEKGNILLRKESGLESFRETLFYFLKYRIEDARTLELAILSFFAGQIYQSDKEDLSDTFNKYSDENG